MPQGSWRTPLIALLLANVVWWLMLTGRAGLGLPDGREPQRLAQQIEPARIEWLLPEGAAKTPVISSSRQWIPTGLPLSVPMPASVPTTAVSTPGVKPNPAITSANDPAAARLKADPQSQHPSASSAATAAPSTKVNTGNLPEAKAPTASLPTNAAAAAPLAPVAATATDATGLRCVEWGSFDNDEMVNAESTLRGILDDLPVTAHTPVVSHQPTVEPSSWVVYLPSQDGLQTASANATSLREMGFTAFYVLQENGPLRFALSLGVFRNRESAQRHVDMLTSRGVKGALIHARVPPNARQWLRIAALEERTAGALRAAVSTQAAGSLKGRAWRRCS